MHYSPISAADIGILDLFNKTEGFQGARRNGADKPRDATHDEIHAYLRWVAKRAGVDVSHGTHCELKWSEYARGVVSRCIGATIGGVFVAMPGADQTGAVECEILDSDGNVERAFTMRPKGGRGGKLECAKSDEAALKAANKGKAKRAPKVAPPPVEVIATPAPPLAEIEGEGVAVASPVTEAATIYDAPIGPILPAKAPEGIKSDFAPPCEANALNDALSARVAEIEACLAAMKSVPPQSGELPPSLGECVQRVHAPVKRAAVAFDDRPRRLRIVRAYLALRKQREGLRARVTTAETCIRSAENQRDAMGKRLQESAAMMRKLQEQLENEKALATARLNDAMKLRRQRARLIPKMRKLRGLYNATCRFSDAKTEQREEMRAELATAKAKRARTVTKARDNARKARAAMHEMAFNQMATENLLAVRCARIEHLERNMADPMMPERQSDIARLVRERDAARDERDAALAKAARIEMSTDSLSAQIDAMALRVVRAEQALKRAGITPLAAVA